MEISLDKNAFVITGDEQRYNLFAKIFEHYKLPIPKKFNACRSFNDRGVTGCTYSHYVLYKFAQTFDLPYIIIFEDDVLPRKDILNYFINAFSNLPPDWKYLKLEDTVFSDYKNVYQYNEYWFKGIHTWDGSGSAAYVIKEDLYPIIIKHIETVNFSSKVPIDVIFRQNIEHIMDGCYVSKKMMFLQHNFHHQKTISPKFRKNNVRKTDLEDMKNFEIDLFEDNGSHIR